MSKPVPAIDYLATPGKHPVPAFCVVYGDEDFLKRHALLQIRQQALVGADADFSCTEFTGDDVDFRTVMDELSTFSMFGGGRRVVIVADADSFVSQYRGRLEEVAANPTGSGVLALEVKTWPSTTRLYKVLADKGLQIECKEPSSAALGKWLVSWAKNKYKATLAPDAVDQLLDIIGPELGLLDQELAKLSLLTTPAGDGKGVAIISAQLVRDNVGGWRAKEVWDLIDAAADGNAAEALRQLDRLFSAGEQPLGVFGPMSSSLRWFTAATRWIRQEKARGRNVTPSNALTQTAAKIWPDKLRKAENQMKNLGYRRAVQLLRWLLEADLAMKGSHSSPPRARFVIEQLIARMAKTPATK